MFASLDRVDAEMGRQNGQRHFVRPVEQILNEAMTALARRTAAEKRLPLDWDGLERFEQELLGIWGHGDDEIDVDLDDDEDEDEDGEEKRDADGGEARWTRFVQLASFAGEMLRQEVNGRWIVKTDSGDLVPLFYECSQGNKSLSINVIGKAVKMKANGQEDSVRFLASSAIAMLRG